MRVNLFQVVTFASDPRHGNPAFVLTGVGNASDELLKGACGLLRTDVIAVVGEPAGGEIPLRFFTGNGPHAGPGHSTLAAAHTVLRNGSTAPRSVTFRLTSGEQRPAYLEGDRIMAGFPLMQETQVDRLTEMAEALGARPRESWVAPFGYVAVFDDPAVVAGLEPDMVEVSAFDRSAVIATAIGNRPEDIVIRTFAPNVGLPEDPVCGTAHRIIIPYWSSRLGKKNIHSRQLSPRGGDLYCEDKGDMVMIGGETCLIIDGHLRLPD
jgi:predicted PhzF superfamily epimerase YddE/YHI9